MIPNSTMLKIKASSQEELLETVYLYMKYSNNFANTITIQIISGDKIVAVYEAYHNEISSLTKWLLNIKSIYVMMSPNETNDYYALIDTSDNFNKQIEVQKFDNNCDKRIYENLNNIDLSTVTVQLDLKDSVIKINDKTLYITSFNLSKCNLYEYLLSDRNEDIKIMLERFEYAIDDNETKQKINSILGNSEKLEYFIKLFKKHLNKYIEETFSETTASPMVGSNQNFQEFSPLINQVFKSIDKKYTRIFEVPIQINGICEIKAESQAKAEELIMQLIDSNKNLKLKNKQTTIQHQNGDVKILH